MGLFSFLKKYDFTKDLPRLLDEIDEASDLAFGSNEVDLKKRLLTIKTELRKSNFKRKQTEAFEDAISSLLKEERIGVFSEAQCARMEQIMFSWKKGKEKQKTAIENNDDAIRQLLSEISILEHEIKSLEASADKALDSKERALWNQLDAKKKTKIKLMVSKETLVKRLSAKNSNLEIAQEVSKMAEINKTLLAGENIVDTEKIDDELEESTLVGEEIDDESKSIDESFSKIDTTSDFDKAYEEHMLKKGSADKPASGEPVKGEGDKQ